LARLSISGQIRGNLARAGRLIWTEESAVQTHRRRSLISWTLAVAVIGGVLTVGLSPREADAAFPGAPGKVAFVTARDGNFEIYTMDSDGSDTVNVTNSPGTADDDPAWSPEGARIAFRRAGDVWVMDAGGANPVNLTPGVDTGGNGQAGRDPAWAPDGSAIAYSDGDDIWTVTPEGTDWTNLTNTLTGVGIEGQPSWSPDGSQIAYVRGADIWLMNDDGSNQSPLTQTSAAEQAPDWSPDGNLFVYQRGAEIWTVKPDRTGAKAIASGTGKGGTDPAWSPDASRIVFSSEGYDSQNGPDVFVMGLNGAGVTRIGGAANFGDMNPSWQPTVDATDLAVSLADTPDPVRLDHAVTYTATITNNGPVDARLAGLYTGVPVRATFDSVTPSQGTCRKTVASIVCRLGALPTGAAATVAIQVTPTPAFGTFDLSLGATLFSSQGDTDATNDTDEERTAVLPPPGPDPVARLNWVVPDRLRDYDGDGLVDEETFNSPKAAVVPFKMTLVGCDSTPRREVTQYSFRVTLPSGDVLHQTSANCKFSFNPPKEGLYPTKLTIKTFDGGTATTEVDVPFKDYWIVSLGDSVGSGEGNPDRISTKIIGSNEVWQDQRCHRTAKSGPSQAALALETSDWTSSVTFTHLACSGAQITAGILYHYAGIEPNGTLIPPQATVLQELMDTWHRKPDAVLISVGANDAEFADAVMRCLLPDRCQNDPDFVAEVTRRLSRLPSRFDLLDQKLDALGIPGGKVFITEYFDPTRDDQGTYKQCLPTLYPSEWEWAEKNVVFKLNDHVRAAAELPRHGWHYVGGIAHAFLRHGYCANAGWVVRLEQSFVFQGDQNGAFHPNLVGHLEYGRRILDAVRRTLR